MSQPALDPEQTTGLRVGRYLLHRQIARGGMATIHLARLMGDEGFSRIVAAKRLLPEFAEDADFVTMFLDEARVASKIHHKNVVPVLDVVMNSGEIILVQEFVHGAPLNQLLKIARQDKAHVPVSIAVALVANILSGLHAAHETTDEIGMPLNIVHRDVSPQNIMVATDGTARLLDFGVAKATMAAHVTRENAFKGKLAYSAPEQLNGSATRQSDIYSAAIVLWEAIVGHRMHEKLSENEIVAKIMMGNLPSILDALAGEKEFIAKSRWAEIEAIAPVLQKGLALELHERYATAAAMEADLVHAMKPAPPLEVIGWLRSLGREVLDRNEKLLAAEEASWRRTAAPARLTPLPAERRPSMSMPAMPEIENVDATRRRRRWIALAASLVVAGAAVAVVMTRGRGESASTSVEHAAPGPAGAPAPSTPPPAAAAASPSSSSSSSSSSSPSPSPSPSPAASAPAATPPAAAANEPSVPIVAPPSEAPVTPGADKRIGSEPARKRPTRTRVPTPAKDVAKAPPPAAVKTAPATQPATPPATTAPPATPPAAATDCNPPYYFQGSKKIFKPQCL